MLDKIYNSQDILFFSVIDWDSAYQRPQHIVSQLSKEHRIFYFNVNFIGNDTKVFTTENLHNIYRIVLPSIIGERLYDLNLEDTTMMLVILDNIIKQYNIKDSTIIVECPNWYPIVMRLKNKYNFKIIFDYIEDYTLLNTNDDNLLKCSKALLRSSDYIIAASQFLYEKAHLENANVGIVRNSKNYDWREKARDIDNIIKKIYPLVSIIIVTYNNIQYTMLCIKSILEKTAYPNYEIVIVDNLSKDGTRDYLKNLETEHENIRIILNDKNFGFAKGNNIGIKKSKGKYIILLNNDTVVTRGWISWMLKYLDRDSNIGMVGPVTNSIGNEAKINVWYTNIDDIDTFSKEYTFSHVNEIYPKVNVLAMFCVCFKNELIDKIGYLDEGFGVGMFEDDDFSERVKFNGYKIVCVEDVFIHHFGSASFNKIERENYQKLFEENKKRFEENWNIQWIPHRYRMGIH